MENPGVLKGPVDLDLHLTGAKGTVVADQRYGTPIGPYENFTMTLKGLITNDTAGATLVFDVTEANVDNAALDVQSRITGDLGLKVGTATYGTRGRVQLSNVSNDYSGATVFYGYSENCGSLALADAAVIPTNSAFSASNGRISLLMRDDSTWDNAKIAALANRTRFSNRAALTVDATGADDRTVVWDGSSVITNGVPFGPERDTEMRVTGLRTNQNFVVCGGAKLTFTGDSSYEIGSVETRDLARGLVGTNEIAFADAKEIRFPTNGLSFGSTKFPVRLSVANACLAPAGDIWDTPANVSGHSLRLGNAADAQALLTIGDGAVLSNKLYLGYEADSVAAIHQTGGVNNAIGHGKITIYQYQPQIGAYGHGYYLVENGELNLFGRPTVGFKSTGMLEVRGGAVTVRKHEGVGTTPWCFLGYGSGARGHIYVSGGTFALADNCYMMPLYSSRCTNSLTVAGASAYVDMPFMWNTSWGSGGGVFGINLNAGVLRSAAFSRRTNADDGRTNPENVYVNFNGGTLRNNSTDMFPTSPDKNYFISARIYENGATLDSPSATDFNLNIPLRAASGNGVRSVPIPGAVADRTFIAPPEVRIENAAGDAAGCGAMAYALLDRATGRVTGIDITARGWDYAEAPTATFYLGNEKIGESLCVIGANAAGPLTKTGGRTLTINSTGNGWTKTIAAGGTIKLGVEGALPANAPLVLRDGGKVDFNSKTATVQTVTYGAGAGSMLNAANVTYASGSAYHVQISVEEILAGKSVAFTDNRDLADMTVDITGDFSLLDPAVCHRYPNIITTTKSFANLDSLQLGRALPNGWRLRATAKSIRLENPVGTLLILR